MPTEERKKSERQITIDRLKRVRDELARIDREWKNATRADIGQFRAVADMDCDWLSIDDAIKLLEADNGKS